jgi:hypothetical protein
VAACSVTYKETFFIHIIAVLRLYTVMVHLLPQNIEVVPERMLRLGLVSLKVESVEISAVKDGLVPTLKVCRPVLARLRTTYQGGPCAHHCWCRRQTPLAEPLYLLDKPLLLLVGE